MRSDTGHGARPRRGPAMLPIAKMPTDNCHSSPSMPESCQLPQKSAEQHDPHRERQPFNSTRRMPRIRLQASQVQPSRTPCARNLPGPFSLRAHGTRIGCALRTQDPPRRGAVAEGASEQELAIAAARPGSSPGDLLGRRRCVRSRCRTPTRKR